MALAGTIGVFVTESGLDARTAVFFRCSIAALCLAVYGWYKGLLNRDVLQSGELRYILIGGVALVANWVFIYQAFLVFSITISIATYYVEPFFLIGLGVLLLKEKFYPSTLVWTGVAFVGLLLIIFNSDPSAANSNMMLQGVSLALVAAFLYAVATIMGKKIRKTSPVVVTLIQMVLGTIVLVFFADFEAARSGQTQWGYVIALGAVHTAFLYVIFYQAVRGVPASLIAPLSFLDPVVTILSDVLVYHATLSPLQIVGIAAILCSAYFVSRPAKPALAPAETRV
jgi:drug/metabolite transporter (DMT)-like permease